jgi:hypothetical protein
MRVRRATGETAALILGRSLVLLDDAEAIR